MAVDEKTLRSELVKQPRPARIMVRTEDGDTKEVQGAGKGGTTWAAVARTIMALVPSMVELYDEQGTLLRAINAEQSTLEVHAGTTAGVAGYSVANLHADPETARLVHFANLLSDAWRFSTGLAFTKIVEIVQAQADRAASLEVRLEKAEAAYRREMQDKIEDAFEQAEQIREAAQAGNQEGALGMLTQFMGGLQNGKAAAPNGGKA
jgi:hypothetical protein